MVSSWAIQLFLSSTQTIKTHTRFVQDVQYAPSGDLFASVGSDYKAFLYDGKTGDTLAEFIDDPHKGSIVRSLIFSFLANEEYILHSDGLFMERG